MNRRVQLFRFVLFGITLGAGCGNIDVPDQHEPSGGGTGGATQGGAAAHIDGGVDGGRTSSGGHESSGGAAGACAGTACPDAGTAGNVGTSGEDGGNSGSSGDAGSGASSGGLNGGAGGDGGQGGDGGHAGTPPVGTECATHPAPIQIGGLDLEWAESVAVTEDGGMFVSGRFSGEVNFGSGPLRSEGAEDMFLAHYGSDGALAWVRQGGGPLRDAGQSVVAREGGSVYVAGSFMGTARFGAVSLTTSASSSVFLANYARDGSLLWVRAVGGSSFSSISQLALTRDGSAQLVGTFSGDWASDPDTTLSSARGDTFVARYGPDGTLAWITQAGEPGDSQRLSGLSLAVLGDGGFYVAGEFHDVARIGGTELTATVAFQAFVAKYDAQGQLVWARQSDGQGHAFAWSVAASDDGSAYVAGEFGGDISLSTTPLGGAGESLFLAKYRHDGSVEWVTTGTGRSAGLAVAVERDGSAGYVTGGVHGPARLGSLPMDAPLDDFTMFVAKFDAAGAPVWARLADGQSWGRGITLRSGCSPRAIGTFSRDWSFGSAAFTCRGQEDIFVVPIE